MVNLFELESYTNTLLAIEDFRDYCPNGLQVEGRHEVKKIVAGVTASQALIDSAVDAGADALLVHHGFFWRNENPVIRGMKRARIKTLLDHGISLLAYHLPLDAHPELGNNAQLAAKLGLVTEGRFGDGELGFWGRLSQPSSAQALAITIDQALERMPLLAGDEEKNIETVAWCTGAAQSYIEGALELGVDAFISGEISESTVHFARETGLVYFSAGHHATERYGVQALGRRLVDEFGLDYEFIDINNPV